MAINNPDNTAIAAADPNNSQCEQKLRIYLGFKKVRRLSIRVT
jgi:hypothetical protein